MSLLVLHTHTHTHTHTLTLTWLGKERHLGIFRVQGSTVPSRPGPPAPQPVLCVGTPPAAPHSARGGKGEVSLG